MGTQARGVSTTDDSHAGTPLTREAMAELLELHRAGQQADREVIECDRHRATEIMIQKQQDWVRQFVSDSATKITTDVSERIAKEIAHRFMTDRRLRVKIDNLFQWSYVKATLLLALVIAALWPLWVICFGGIMWVWRNMLGI